jgi:hypothetical protein
MSKKGDVDKDKLARRGVRDPWRAHLDETDESANTLGTTASDHPLDADLKPVRKHMFRMPETDNTILVSNANSDNEAVLRLIEAVRDCSEIREVLTEVGFVCGIEQDVPLRGFVMKAKDYVVCLPQANNAEEGFRRFVNTLLWHNRNNTFRKFLQEYGIEPLLV